MGTVVRQYGVFPFWTGWMAAPFFNLAPNSKRMMEFTFAEPLASSRQGKGVPYGPLQLEFKYIRNGGYVTETRILPAGRGKISVESSSGDEIVWGQVQYRIKSLGGLPTVVRELVNDGLTWPPPSQ